ncbi:nucleotidyltransferase family protein [Sphingomonas sp. MG17]|uniref:Nucleotidyltransferase family protein n=1 Tax=Sphingomonas tagetis TaxID=2949092 RepID=A0A9X2HTN6_9SPHN|nr:nucleotidyltransferase family protein [Sphingomonas tagetis]MCP3731730.1 nucleotidyltransferase family protein [Sphingomonas tagetis]
MSGALLARALREPQSVEALDGAGWTALLAAARAEQLIGSLAWRVDGLAMPDAARRVLADARAAVEQGRLAALWEAEMARRALASSGMPVVLLKGTAFVAAGLAAGMGRQIGDLDILVPRERIEEAETALLAAGWEWVKPDPYDDEYYRRWMHELPPLIHRERDRMIDVHHTILPLTAKVTPDATALIESRVALENGLYVLPPEGMVVHAAAHLFADGDLQGGLRNLWDIHCLTDEFGGAEFDERLAVCAARHGLTREVARAVRLSGALFGDGDAVTLVDRLYIRRLLARDGWGQPTRKLTEQAFYLRGHWLRMPPLMLAKHLWTKWRKGYRPAG